MLIALFADSSCFAETKKVLVLQIIEENWDDLEFDLPKYNAPVGWTSTPITNKEVFKRNEIKIETEKTNIKSYVNSSIVNNRLSKIIKVYIKHNIIYYGKAYMLGEQETFMRDSLRIDYLNYNYSYNIIPEKIPLLVEPQAYVVNYKKYIPADWHRFQEIRLVKDIYIKAVSEKVDFVIVYMNNNYEFNMGEKFDLPKQEISLSRTEMMKYRENYYDYYKEKCKEPWMGTAEGKFKSQLSEISVLNEVFHFGTKVTIFNYGYMELN